MLKVEDLSEEFASQLSTELLVIRKQANRKITIARDDHHQQLQIANESYRETLEQIHLETEKSVRALYSSFGVEFPAETAG